MTVEERSRKCLESRKKLTGTTMLTREAVVIIVIVLIIS